MDYHYKIFMLLIVVVYIFYSTWGIEKYTNKIIHIIICIINHSIFFLFSFSAHMQTTFHWSCPPLWNIDRAMLEDCNVKSNIKSHGCNSKKLINTKSYFYLFCVHIHTPVSPYPYTSITISIHQYHHIHTPVSQYPYTSITISIHQYHHIHTPVSLYPYTSITISIHQYHHIHTPVSPYP